MRAGSKLCTPSLIDFMTHTYFEQSAIRQIAWQVKGRHAIFDWFRDAYVFRPIGNSSWSTKDTSIVWRQSRVGWNKLSRQGVNYASVVGNTWLGLLRSFFRESELLLFVRSFVFVCLFVCLSFCSFVCFFDFVCLFVCLFVWMWHWWGSCWAVTLMWVSCDTDVG